MNIMKSNHGVLIIFGLHCSLLAQIYPDKSENVTLTQLNVIDMLTSTKSFISKHFYRFIEHTIVESVMKDSTNVKSNSQRSALRAV